MSLRDLLVSYAPYIAIGLILIALPIIVLLMSPRDTGRNRAKADKRAQKREFGWNDTPTTHQDTKSKPRLVTQRRRPSPTSGYDDKTGITWQD